MQIIIDFDDCERVYEISEDVAYAARCGESITITVCHPDYGEKCEIKIDGR